MHRYTSRREITNQKKMCVINPLQRDKKMGEQQRAGQKQSAEKDPLQAHLSKDLKVLQKPWTNHGV